MEKEEKEIIATLERIAKEVDEDVKVGKLAEEYQRKYGTLTEENLRKMFTI